MPLDFSPLLRTDPGAAFMQGQDIARQREQQNLLRQAQMQQMAMQQENMLAQREERQAHAQQRQAESQEAARRRAALDKAAALFGQAGQNLDLPTLNQGVQHAMESRDPHAIQLMTKLRDDFIAQKQYEQESAAIFGAPTAGAAPAAPAALAAPAAPAAGAAPVNAMVAPPAAPAAPVNAMAAGPTREQLQRMVMSPSARMQAQGKALIPLLEKPEKQYEPSELQKTLGDLKAAAPGSPEAQALQARVRMLTTREPKEPREPPAPIPVVDPATGQVKYVPREQAVGMTPPQFMESLTPKERQQREAKFPQATSAVKTFENTSNTLIKDLETLAKHPGLGSITGIAAGRIPGVTPAGREAEALYDKIVARGGFQELQNMRQASPTGGALGNVSNKEGEQLRQAFAAIDRRQDAASVRKAINDAIQQIRASQQNVREAYDLTYEYKQGGGAAPAPSPSPRPSAPAPAAARPGATVSNW